MFIQENEKLYPKLIVKIDENLSFPYSILSKKSFILGIIELVKNQNNEDVKKTLCQTLLECTINDKELTKIILEYVLEEGFLEKYNISAEFITNILFWEYDQSHFDLFTKLISQLKSKLVEWYKTNPDLFQLVKVHFSTLGLEQFIDILEKYILIIE